MDAFFQSSGFGGNLDCHPPLFGELDGIADQVDENLPQTDKISAYLLWDIIGYGTGQADVFFQSHFGEELDSLLNTLAK